MNIDRDKEDIKKRLQNKERRDAFVSAYTDETIPFQIRALREQVSRKWTQEDLALRAGMKQERISALENPNYGSYSLRTLKQLASAFDVALIVRFVSFGDLAEWKLNLSSESLEVPSFDKDPYFNEQQDDVTLSIASEYNGRLGIRGKDYLNLVSKRTALEEQLTDYHQKEQDPKVQTPIEQAILAR